MSWSAGARFAVGTLSIFPIHVTVVNRDVAGRAMTLAPAAGLLLGLIAATPLWWRPDLLGAALSLGLLALLTRGLHLDGLADLADGLGSGKPADQALQIMKKSDIGPFGVMSLIFLLLTQAAALSSLGPGLAPVALVTAAVSGRLALTWACRTTVPSARPDGLGAMVAGTVRRSWVLVVTLVVVGAVPLVGVGTQWIVPATGAARIAEQSLPVAASSPAEQTRLAANDAVIEQSGLAEGSLVEQGWLVTLTPTLAALGGLAVALLLLRHTRRRLGGVTGDVLGALVETATTAALVVFAALV
ncbi:adenosylcobinamide-GDP ribazoletransferase [Nonomuraea soli]|uniref:Adenosylcobinamide-GDP ribazoletransferase n=1 Tax=Nonomuraea soli TaxID=1032476 RepID=A0A7W0CEC7_9ACTN|nr:adenosylcobinamide-GDP ribazoletransferase [Nonomuraea soli]MBA2889430.1 adenosylcobinamide-GDP ribazoletransferase [Nonomuraea soli]